MPTASAFPTVTVPVSAGFNLPTVNLFTGEAHPDAPTKPRTPQMVDPPLPLPVGPGAALWADLSQEERDACLRSWGAYTSTEPHPIAQAFRAECCPYPGRRSPVRRVVHSLALPPIGVPAPGPPAEFTPQ